MTLNSPATGLVGVAASGTVQNTGTVSQSWTLASMPSATITPSSGTTAAGSSAAFTITAATAGSYSVSLTNSSGGSVVGSPDSLVISAAGASDLINLDYDAQTPEQISIYCPTMRAPAAGTRIQVRYRLTGDATWLNAHELIWIDPAHSPTPAAYLGHAAVESAFAGTIFDLTPGSAYDVELTIQEPSLADVVVTGTHSTRALPAASGAANKTANSAGTIATQCAGLNPGDVLEIANGIYTLSGLQLTRSGSAGNPIYIRGQSQAGVILTDTTGSVIQINEASHIIIENMTIRGAETDHGTDTANYSDGVRFWGGRAAPQTNITLRNLIIEGCDQGIVAAKAVNGLLAYNNTLTGTSAWDRAYTPNPLHPDLYPNYAWSKDGIRIPGLGNCAWSNTVQGYGDAFAVDAAAYSAAVYFYRNHVPYTCDDGMECDYIQRGGLYDNWFGNSATGISGDLVYGGPMFVFRNVFINVIRQPLKLTSSSHGLLYYNNTMLHAPEAAAFPNAVYDSAHWYQAYAPGQWRFAYRNNIFVGRGTRGSRLLYWASELDHAAWTHNAWYPNDSVAWSVPYANVAAARAGLPAITTIFGAGQRFTDDVICASNPWDGTVTLGTDFTTQFTGTPPTVDLSLAAGVAKNTGIAVPGITTGYSGAAPDMGAVIEGRPLVTYGASEYGVLGAAAASLTAGSWLEITSSTNAASLTDTDPISAIALSHFESYFSSGTYYFMTNWPGNATWDPVTKRILLVGAAQGLASETPAGAHTKVMRLDVTTGQFSSQWNPVNQNVTHVYDANSTIPLGGYIYRRDYASAGFWKMDLATNVWSSAGTLTGTGFSSVGDVPSLEVHPTLGASGSIIQIGQNGKVGRVDIASGTRSTVSASLSGVASNWCPVCSYHPGIDAVVMGGGNTGSSLYTLDNAGTVTLLTASLPAGISEIGPTVGSVLSPDPQGRAYAWLFDTRASMTRKLWRLNLTTGAWTDMGALPATFGANEAACIACIPELGVLVALDGGSRTNSKVWLYRPA